MALSDEVLNNFFTRTKKPLIASFPKEESSRVISIPRYRVFDEPTDNKTFTTVQIEKNSRQTQDKLKTNSGQKELIAQKDIVKLKTELKTELKTNSRQTQDNSSISYSFSSLVGLQRKITLFIYEACRISRNRITNPLSIEHLAESCQTPRLSVPKTIQRLEKKGIILRFLFKEGRGGWTQYELPDAIFHEIMQEEIQTKLKTNSRQTQDKLETELKTELKTTSSSSSSSIYKSTTTKDSEKLSSEWEEIDIEPLRAIGFTRVHLQQIASMGKLEPEAVQQSVYTFAFDLTYNNKADKLKTEPLNYLMGILRKGDPYAPPVNYESPEDKKLREDVEREKERERKQAETNEKEFNSAFYEWRGRFSDNELNQFIPEESRQLNGISRTFCLRKHFTDEVWVKRKEEIITSSIYTKDEKERQEE